MSPLGIAAGVAALAVAAAGVQTLRVSWLQTEVAQRDAALVTAGLAQSENTRKTEAAWASRVQGVTDAKDANLRRVRDALAADLDGLRDRAARADAAASSAAASACTGATGAELSREDAAFLAGEAARADALRAELGACQGREQAVRP